MAKAGFLNKLTLATKQEKDTLSKELQRRNKLLTRLAEQREMASCVRLFMNNSFQVNRSSFFGRILKLTAISFCFV